MNKKIIYFDIDGTIYDNGNKEISPSTIYSLKKLKENNYILAVCTGRPFYLLKVIDEIKDLFDYFIVMNGKQIIDRNSNVIYDKHVNKERAISLVNDLEKYNILYGLESNNDEVISRLDEDAYDFINKAKIRVPRVDRNFINEKEIYQIWLYDSKGQVELIKDKYSDFLFLRWGSCGYDVVHRNATKQTAATFLNDYLKINDSYAFGDGENDIYLKRAVNHFIAMGNASVKLKEEAEYVTTSVNKDGIYSALVYFKLI